MYLEVVDYGENSKKGTPVYTRILACCSERFRDFAAGLEKELFDLTSLGIMQGDENGEMHLEGEVTRAEFAAMVLRLTKMEDLAELYKNDVVFSDVPAGEWYTGYINGTVNAGYMNGYSEGTFGPNDPVLFEQAAKVLITILGYEPVAQQNGGYPNGYTMTATTTGLTKGAAIAEPFFARYACENVI